MKHSIMTLILASTTLLSANQFNPNKPSNVNEHIKNAVTRVESAQKDTISDLKSMIHTVDKARASGIENNDSIATQIIETHALSEIAKNTAKVEITKAKAITLITQAIDKLDPSSMGVIADAIASVEVAKAKAKANIVKATGHVEVSKTKTPVPLSHPKETLTIAKNVSAIQIAKSVAQTEVARAVSLIEVAKSSIENAVDSTEGEIEMYTLKELEDIKAKATANISSYLAQIEVMKANMLSKIAEEVARVEIAKLKTKGLSQETEKQSTTYPHKLIKAN